VSYSRTAFRPVYRNVCRRCTVYCCNTKAMKVIGLASPLLQRNGIPRKTTVMRPYCERIHPIVVRYHVTLRLIVRTAS